MDMYPTTKLEGYSPLTEPLHFMAVDAVIQSLFEKIGFPPLKSAEITIRNIPEYAAPVYAANSAQEMIVVVSAGNYPYQFAYQLAHEFGHLSARGDLRYPRTDGLLWIEEALCEAHSLVALSRIAQSEGPLKDGAASYLQHLLGSEIFYYGLPQDFFGNRLVSLTESSGSTEDSNAVARELFYRVPHDKILEDNRRLKDVEVGLSLHDFLQAWRGIDGDDVPSLLLSAIPR